MNNFEYHYPVRQYFGKGCAEEAIKSELRKTGANVLLAYGGGSIKRTGLYDKIQSWLSKCGKQVTDFGGIMPNPTYAKVQEGARVVRENNIDFILAVGGGSVIDCCKIVSAQALTDEDVWDMWYVHHLLPTDFVPMGAVVTASGTGAEQNNGAVMRNVITNLRRLIQNPDDDFARGELMWASAMAENGMLKLGKQTDFQCHMIEHAVGAYTDCNHGQGLAVIHPALYRRLLEAGKEKLARMAETGWGVKGTTIEETAMRGIEALEAFIREIGLPTHWSEMGITDESMLRAAADTCFITPGCCRQLTRDEIFELLMERM